MNPLKFILYSLCFLQLISAQAQSSPTALELELQRAHRAFDSKRYTTSANLFKKVFPKVKGEEEQNKVLYMIAESYRMANNFKQAYDWYERLVNTKYPDPQIIYSYGLLLKNFERYEDATRQFNDFLFEVPNHKQAKIELQACAIAAQWKSNPEKITLTNLNVLNTQYSDYAPMFAKGQLIWSSSRPEATGNEIFEWTGQKCSDFFVSTQSGSGWTKAQVLKGSANSNFNEGVAWIDSSASTLYFTQCNGTDGRGVNCKIYESHFINGHWSAPISLPFNSDTFTVGHPAMTTDGKRMYFASNMPGGYGEKDIYYVDHNPNTESWGKPVNLGPKINTAEDDMFPFIDEKGVLYFASKGHAGMGGLDLYRTDLNNGVIGEITNLKSPINSGGDDFGIAFIPETQRESGKPFAYFTSNRVGGMGDDDLYSIAVKPFLFMLKGTAVDKETGVALAGARIELTDSTGKVVFSEQTNSKGEFATEIPIDQKTQLMASKLNYFSSTPLSISSIGLNKDSLLEVVLPLTPVPTEEVEFVLQGIYYDLDKYDLRPASKMVLDSMSLILKNNPTLVIELASHTDSRAPADYNLTLSQKRAQACVNYLVQKGINKNRLVALGYGESRLVNDCADGVECSEEEHQQNRRTAFRVLRSDYKGK